MEEKSEWKWSGFNWNELNCFAEAWHLARTSWNGHQKNRPSSEIEFDGGTGKYEPDQREGDGSGGSGGEEGGKEVVGGGGWLGGWEASE